MTITNDFLGNKILTSPRILTKGDVEVQNIKIGDIHWEFEYGCYIRSKVLTLPVVIITTDGDPQWSWTSQHLKSDRIIEYMVTEGLSHYGPNLYTYEAYFGCREI